MIFARFTDLFPLAPRSGRPLGSAAAFEELTAHRARLLQALLLVFTESAPDVKLRSVPVHQLPSELPVDTPHIESASRARIIEGRRRAVLRRYRQ